MKAFFPKVTTLFVFSLFIQGACGDDDNETVVDPDPFEPIEGPLTTVAGGEFQAPENAFWDSEREVWYVSDFGEPQGAAEAAPGFISRLAADGTLTESRWVDGVGDDPKGMAILNDKLYVAGNTEIIVINIANETIEETVPVPGSNFLNGMTARADRIFVTDSGTNRIYEYVPGNAPAIVLESDDLEAPNGIAAISNTQFVVVGLGTFPPSPASPGHMLRVEGDTVTQMGDIEGFLDGLSKVQNGWLVTDFLGKIYVVDENGENGDGPLLRDLAVDNGLESVADIGFDPASNRFIVPDLSGGTVSTFVNTIDVK